METTERMIQSWRLRRRYADAAERAALAVAELNKDLLCCLQNLVKRDLIKDTEGDHYDEVLEAIAKATGKETA